MAAPVKLTKAEGIALAEALAACVGHANVLLALVGVIGAERATGIVERKEGRISKAETVALVKAIIPLIPGDTLKAKIKVAIAALREAIPERERQDKILAYVLQKIKEWKNPPAVPAAPVVNAGFLRFYGRVNMFATNEPVLREDLGVCASCGVGYTIEMAGWRGGMTAFDGEANLQEAIRMYRLALSLCRKAGLPMLTSITNRNVELTKYGNVGRKFSTIVPAAKRLAQAVFDEGPEGQYVQPVAESNAGNKPVEDFEKWCGNLFKGWNLVYNGNDGRPTKPAYGWPHFAWHPSSTADGGKKGGISVSDTGSIIRQLALDGTMEGPGDPAKIAAWFAKCSAAGAIGAGYYAFKHKKHDAAAIRACAAQPVNNTDELPSGATNLGDDVDLSQAVWHGPNGSGARVTARMDNLKFDGTNFTYKQSGTAGWKYVGKPPKPPKVEVKQLNSYACFFVFRDGKWRGGKFDWCSTSRDWRDVKNIYGKYTGGIVPVPGETVRVCLVSLDLSQRTNAPATVWRSK